MEKSRRKIKLKIEMKKINKIKWTKNKKVKKRLKGISYKKLSIFFKIKKIYKV